MTMTHLHERLLIVVGTAVVYALLFFLNEWIFGKLTFDEAVNWIYLPSGLRLAFVMLFGMLGAAGIVLSSTLIAAFVYFEHDLLTALVTGTLSGLAPYLARHLSLIGLGIDKDLIKLTGNKLLAMSVIFALTSATLHQVFYSWRGYTEDFLAATMVMAFGDLAGTIVMLYVARFALQQTRRIRLP